MDQPVLSVAAEIGCSDVLVETPLVQEVVVEAPAVAASVAPWWHTALMLVAFAAFVLMGQTRHYTASASRFTMYGSQVLFSWLLFGSVIAGVRDREGFFRQALRNNATRWAVELRRAVAIYFVAAILAITTGVVIRAAQHTYDRQHSLQAGAGATHASASDKPQSGRLFDTRTTQLIAPHTGAELLTWLLVSLSAGFCEEMIFRGYLLAQAKSLFAWLRWSREAAAAASVLVTAVLFGAMHVYQGLGGAAMVCVLGAVYAVVALKYGNLRSAIVAHALQDSFAGTVLFLRHLHAATMQ